MSAEFRVYDNLGYTVIVLSNYDGVAGSVADFIDELIMPPPLPPPSSPPPPLRKP